MPHEHTAGGESACRETVAPYPLVSIHDPVFKLDVFSGVIGAATESGRLSTPMLERLCSINGTWRNIGFSYVTTRELLLEMLHDWDRDEAFTGHAVRTNFAIYGNTGLQLAMHPTMADCMRFGVARSQDLHGCAWRMTAETEDDGTIVLTASPLFPDPELEAILAILFVADVVAIHRSFGTLVNVVDEVELRDSGNVSRSVLESYCGCPVRIGGNGPRIRVNQRWLQSRPLLAHLAPSNADTTKQTALPLSTPLQVLMKHHAEIRTVDDMAHHLRVSRRTLARRLARDGTSFSELSARVRCHHATRLLLQGSTTDDVAELLGFSDARSFRRAFLGWTGKTPSEYRTAAN